MKLSRLLLLFAFPFSLTAQSNDLEKKITNYTKQDTIRVELLIDYCVSTTFSVSNKMLTYANEANRISKKINYKKGEIRSLNCIGNYFYQQGILDKAIVYYTKAIRISEKSNDVENIIIGKSNLASIYIQIKESKKALKLFLESDQLLIETGKEESQNRAALLTNIGAAYSSLGQHDESLKYHFRVLALCKKKNILFGIALAESNIGNEYVQLKKYDNALPYLISSLQISKKNGIDSFLGQIYTDIGLVYYYKKRFAQSITYLEKGVLHCSKINDQPNLLRLNNVLQKVYAENGDFQKAYLTSQNFIRVNDSLNNKEKQKIITETNTKYESEKKEAAIKALHQKNTIAELESKKKTNTLYLVLLFFTGIATTSYVLFSRYKEKKKNEILQNQLAETEKLLAAEKKVSESELKALKSQMNPHFIFNALNSIQMQFMYGDKLIANEQLNNFTYLTRQILEVSGKKSIPIADEIEILTKYLELEQLRFKKDFTYSITVSDKIDEDFHKIPPMLIQPIIENSIKHGLLHQKGDKKVQIHFDIDDKESHLICTIIDNGIGRQKSAEIKAKNNPMHHSFSTKAIEQRLDLLNEKLQLHNLIAYTDLVSDENEVNGTQVVIKIPFI